jgi:hypothetical protein
VIRVLSERLCSTAINGLRGFAPVSGGNSRDPFRRAGGELFGAPLQFSEVVEGIHIVQLARMDQGHIQIAEAGTV